MTNLTTTHAAPRPSLLRETRRYALFLLLALMVVGFWVLVVIALVLIASLFRH